MLVPFKVSLILDDV